MVWHCYVPRIQFNSIIFSLEKKTSTFKALIGSFNCVEGLCRSHEIYEVQQGLAMLVFGWVTAWCKHSMCRSFPAGSFGLEL